MNSRSIQHQRRFQTAATILLAGLLAGPVAAETTVTGRVMHEIGDSVQVNVGTDQGLRQGLLGSLRLYDGRVFGFEVLHVTQDSALLRLVGDSRNDNLLSRNAELTFELAPLATTETVGEDAERAKSGGKTLDRSAKTGDTNDFVPLLARAQPRPQGSQRRNVSHGRMYIRQMLHIDSEDNLDYSMTRVGSSGNIKRLEGSLWSFDWAGDLRYRDGDAFSRHPDYQEAHLDLYRASVQRAIDDGGFVRIGRFLPQQLPGIGYVDGVQGETLRTEHLRLGVVGGLKPDRRDLQASADEPLVAGYATVDAGQRSGTYYSGTVGLLNSYYDGQTDRLALLFDQRANLWSNVTLYSTATVDFDAGAAETRNETRLTQLDVTVVSKLSSVLTVRAGVDHWERPDHQAERELLPFEDDRFFDDGYWRYWIGSNQNLPWKLHLYEEVAFIDSDTSDDLALWRVRATRVGLFAWRDASATVTVYNLATGDDDGYGLRASGYLPLNNGKLIVQPAAGFRLLDTEPQSEELSLTYLSLRLDGRISKNWTLFGGLTYSKGEEVDSTLFDLGLRFAW